MRRVRTLAALSLIGLLAYCAEPTSNGSTPGFAHIAVRAVAPPSLAMFAPALVVEQVAILVGTSFNEGQFDTVASKVVPFGDNTNEITLSLDVPVPGLDTLELILEYRTADGTPLFQASSQIIVGPGRKITPNLVPEYIGPGNNISFMFINGDDTTVTAGSDVQLDVEAFDGQENSVPEFYLTWSTDDPRVIVTPRGLVHTRPGVTQLIQVTARTPNGVEASTLITSQSVALMALAPDSVDVRPGEEQLFHVTVGSNFDISTTWSVGGVDGGNATLGTITQQGLYTAPLTVIPNRETSVCVQKTGDATIKGCAKVRMPANAAGDADIVMINDLNLFDDLMMEGAGNQQFVKNLVASTGGGSRSQGTTVWSERGRNSGCTIPIDSFDECGDAAKGSFFATIKGAGYNITSFDSLPADLTAIPADVRAIIFWMPLLQFSTSEINGLKAFAAQGGRIVFIGENVFFYTQAGITVENKLLTDLGASMSNRGDLIDCVDSLGLPDYYVTPTRSLRAHPLTAGVPDLRYLCASEVRLSSKDKPLFYDQANKKVLGAVAAISLEPLPLTTPVRPTVRLPASAYERPRATSRGKPR